MSEDKLKEFAEEQEGEPKVAKVEKVSETKEQPVGAPLTPSTAKKPWEKSEEHIQTANQIGWDKVKLSDLPTQGLFYPEGTEVVIKSATAAEIRHWSSLNEDNLSALDDMLNYIIERCVSIKYPDGNSSWRDIKEVDRFYLLLAVRERTFYKGENKLQVKVSETEKLDVSKEMIDYITFDDRIMKYYDPDKRCINLKWKTDRKDTQIYLPSVGVTNWLKNYINRKSQMQESFDQDFLNFAPFIIPDWRGLNDATYQRFIEESLKWSNSEISMLTKIREIFADTINPVIRYKDEQGGEREIPLNFLGGVKSIFLVSDPFSELA